MTSLVLGTQSIMRNVLVGWAIATGKLKERFVQARTKEAMLNLNDYMLKDLGLTREEVRKWQ